jgi:hypothetical protein
MKTFMMFFFLLGGVWYPGWYFDGWAPAEITSEDQEAAIIKCLKRKTDWDSAAASYPPPYTFPGIKGNIDKTHVKCIQVVFPKTSGDEAP